MQEVHTFRQVVGDWPDCPPPQEQKSLSKEKPGDGMRHMLREALKEQRTKRKPGEPSLTAAILRRVLRDRAKRKKPAKVKPMGNVRVKRRKG